ncbi:MAG TPA: hypothetical protein VMG31_08800 [Verrucomicrobiae bacterium]|nr:hypothetical protein [Verrucomicrobiae bacterium]
MLRSLISKNLRLGLLAALALLFLLVVPRGLAQDNPDDVPLGDVARQFRKKPAPADEVIDNDNLSQVMKQVASQRAESRGADSVLKYFMAGDGNAFQVSAPDVSCSLSFSANTKALLSNQYAEMDLPPAEAARLTGPATIEGDALVVPVFNGTDWHVSELAIALTVVKKNAPRDISLSDSSLPGALVANDLLPNSEVRPEKKPDTTVIYKMRAAAPPLTTTVFSAPLSVNVAAGDEWHWAIVQAKGYPPQSDGPSASQTTRSDIGADQVPLPQSLLATPPNAAQAQPPQ